MNRADGWTREEERVWVVLNRRFPGLAGDCERVAKRMAVGMGSEGSSRIHYEETPAGFVADIEAFSFLLNDGHSHVSYPVIPDEHNPRVDKKIAPDMAPHPFARLSDCQKVAEEAERILLASLRAAERAVGKVSREKGEN